jgi:hypothetical protein
MFLLGSIPLRGSRLSSSEGVSSIPRPGAGSVTEKTYTALSTTVTTSGDGIVNSGRIVRNSVSCFMGQNRGRIGRPLLG